MDTDYAGLWLRCQIQTGETVVALRQAGHSWRDIAGDLQMGDADAAMRAAALYLASSTTLREGAQEARRDAQPAAATVASPAT